MEINHKLKFNDNEIGISNMSITYAQNPDTCQESDDIQAITISAENNGSGEDGWFYRISMPDGGYWSIDGGNSIKNLIDDFEKRMMMINKYE